MHSFKLAVTYRTHSSATETNAMRIRKHLGRQRWGIDIIVGNGERVCEVTN